MKRLLIFALLMAMTLCGCSTRSEDSNQDSPPPRQLNDVPNGAPHSAPSSTNQNLESLPNQSPGGNQLIDLAKENASEAYTQAISHGAQVHETNDGKSFVVIFQPKSCTKNPEKCDVIASIHGHGSWAFNDFEAWYPHIKDRNTILISLQWYYGGDERTSNYADPTYIYSELNSEISRLNLDGAKIMLHGFSRGSANIYAVKAIDVSKKNWATLTVANAGGAELDYPPTRMIEDGTYGQDVFANTKWFLFCGEKDSEPDHSGCPAMENTSTWLKGKGATVKLRKDSAADHGGFHMRPENVKAALSYFDTIS